jgi:serine/threonine-protein kinase
MFADRYEEIAHLGGGRFGQVWRAHDHYQARDIALKLFERGRSIDVALLEAQALTALESPHIVRIFNTGIADDIPFLVTEVAPYRSLEDHCGDRGGVGVPLDDAIRWTRHVLVGLMAAHSAGIVHRDIKPSNVFMYSADDVRLGDFGVAARLDTHGLASANGDPKIRPPESIEQGIANVGSDIFGVGVTCYFLLTGRYPYEGDSDTAVMEAIVRGERPKIRDLAPHVPVALAQRIDRALHPNPNDRYASAGAMHSALGSLPRYDRVWGRQQLHEGHEACWLGRSAGEVRSLELCVVAEGLGERRIEVRRASGSRSRVREHCRTVRANRLPIELRQTFGAI